MEQWAGTIITVCTMVLSAAGVGKLIRNWQRYQMKESKFMMKMLFEIIDILDGKQINGQIKKLRKEAEQFNIEN